MDPLATSVQFELDEIRSDELPRVAVNLLEAGHDTPSLRAVAGELHPTMVETGTMFAEALQELGVRMTLREACLRRAEFLATGIVSGALEPMTGASELYFLDRHYGVPELDAFLC